MLHSDYITHINNPEDVVYLRSRLLPVNMRLFKTSPEYKKIVLDCCRYIEMLCLTKMEGYKKPHGMSGANAAIPFNIIGIVRNREQAEEYCEIMINPVITETLMNDIVYSQSNCGSLTLPEPIQVMRFGHIDYEFYNEDGMLVKRTNIRRENCGFTIQHEVDHNLGILITDIQV